MKFARRVSRIGESATLAVSRRAKELAAEGVEVIDLSAGEPDFDSPGVAIEAAVVGLREGAMLHVDDDRATLLGDRGARIFCRGRDPQEHDPGADLSDLL